MCCHATAERAVLMASSKGEKGSCRCPGRCTSNPGLNLSGALCKNPLTEKAGQRIERRLRSGRYCWNTVSVEGSAGDVLFQVIDRRCLGRNEPFDQVTDRENSDHLSSFHNRQMPHPLFGHDSHAIDHRIARLYGYEVPSHYLLHASLL